jgi:short-subunit dehydrogenase
MKEWALVTGASEGIGRELAKQFAANQFNVVLTARGESRLEQLANELQFKHGIETKLVTADLADRETPERIFRECRDLPISVLVNNAGFGYQGSFTEEELKHAAEMVEVNVSALVRLTHLFLAPMLARRAGRILNVASTAAFQPGPFMAIYYATKAFVFSFSVALAEELRGSGVSVTTLCPGFTESEFQRRAQMKLGPRGLGMMSAEAVAAAGYRGCVSGKAIVVPGMMNKVTSFVSRRLPARFTARLVRRINGKG